MLRLAGTSRKRLDLGDGEWVEVKLDLSKREFIALVTSLPDDVQRKAAEAEGESVAFKLADALGFQEALFRAFVTDWSLAEHAATVENYLALERSAADAVDNALIKHFQEVVPTKDEEGKPSTSRGRQRKG